MGIFYYQIKGRQSEGFSSNWAFPPIWSDFIEAGNRKEAKVQIDILHGELSKHDFFISIKEITPDKNNHLIRLREINTCKNSDCKRQFSMIEKYQLNDCIGGYDYCSAKCQNECRTNELINNDGYILHEPAIYKITNRTTGMCYIGKTTQAFTLRWYQHFFQSNDTKFHKAIKNTSVTDWTFEVVEIINKRGEGLSKQDFEDFISGRERYYIILFDSVNNGYNTAMVGSPLENELQQKLEL